MALREAGKRHHDLNGGDPDVNIMTKEALGILSNCHCQLLFSTIVLIANTNYIFLCRECYQNEEVGKSSEHLSR